MLTRRAVDDELTFEAVLSAGAEVQRAGFRPDGSFGPWRERLLISGTDLSRLQQGAPVLVDHLARTDFQVGVVETARVVDGRILATVRFSEGAKGREIARDVKGWIRRQLSVGYEVREWRRVSPERDANPVFEATNWLPLETSVVAIGADPDAQFREATPERRFRSMTVETSPTAAEGSSPPLLSLADQQCANSAELARCSAILERTERFGLPISLARELIDQGATLEQAKTRMINARAERQDDSDIRNINFVGHGTGYGPTVTGGRSYDDPATKLEAVTAAIAHRLGAKDLPDHARQYRGATIPDLCGVVAEARGAKLPNYATAQAKVTAARKLSTSDFVQIVANSLGRALVEPYETAQSELAALTKTETVPDFKAQTRVRPSSYPSLLQVREHGEYEFGSITEFAETFVIRKYGRMLGWSWELALADNLNALEQVARTTGLAAANLEAETIATVLLANPNLSDGTAVFHAANRQNLMTAGSALSATSLANAMVLLRRQRSSDLSTYLNLRPQFLITSVELERLARVLTSEDVSPAVPADSTAAFRGLQVLCDPRIPAAEWYLAPSVAAAPNLVLARLEENANGPFVEARDGWNVDQIEMKCRHTLGVAFVDHRLIRATGAA